MKKKLFILLLILFIGHLFFRIYNYRDVYLVPFDSRYWETRYNKSQWVVPNSKNSIGDDGLYAYAAWKYITGADPSLLNAEVPPFGKYVIGLSILLFHNQNIFALLSGALVLGSFFYLNTLLFRNKILAFLPVVLFSFEPLFYTQLRAPYLDLLYLGCLLLLFIAILKKKYILAGIFFGCMMATKSTLTTFLVITLVLGLYMLVQQKYRDIRQLFFIVCIGLLTLLGVYGQFFLLGHTLIDFLKLQKWILNFYEIGAKGAFGDVFSIFLTGVWHPWFAKPFRVSEWQITWPVLVMGSFFSLWYFLKNRQSPFLLICLWIGVYLLFLCFIPVFPRYLLLLLPFMYNSAIWMLFRMQNSIRKKSSLVSS